MREKERRQKANKDGGGWGGGSRKIQYGESSLSLSREYRCLWTLVSSREEDQPFSGTKETLSGKENQKNLKWGWWLGGEDRAHETGEKGFVGPINVLCPPPHPVRPDLHPTSETLPNEAS